ncbi:MAG: CDP-alcohol phosphatidyltransferase family protein [Bacteroidota bacterium]
MKKHIPNFITSLNVFFGSIAVIAVVNNKPVVAATCVGIALLADFLDGFTARLLKVSSPIGKELDSLADMLTFGLVPGLVMARLMQESLGERFPPSGFYPAWWMVGLLIPVFSALRLAKFNLDTRQSDAFYGLPTPANTLWIFSAWLAVSFAPEGLFAQSLQNPFVVGALCVVGSIVLVMDVRLIALKFSSTSWEANRFRYFLIIGGIILGIVLTFQAPPFIILLYICLSLIQNRFFHSPT